MRKLDSSGQGHAGADHILSLLRRVRLDWLLHHFPPRLVRSLYVFVNGFITIGVLALLALLSHNPFVFPSLGPTAYLLFFSPLAPSSSPRNTILGHAVGLVCGYAAFVVTGAGALPFGVHPGIFWPRILAAALSRSDRPEKRSHVLVVNSSGANKKCRADGLPLAASPAHFIRVYRQTSTSRGPLPPSLPPVVKTKCSSRSSPRSLFGGGM
jgi:hypothetical protein